MDSDEDVVVLDSDSEIEENIDSDEELGLGFGAMEPTIELDTNPLQQKRKLSNQHQLTTSSDQEKAPVKRLKLLESQRIVMENESAQLRQELAQNSRKLRRIQDAQERTARKNELLEEQLLQQRKELASLQRSHEKEVQELCSERLAAQQELQDTRMKTSHKLERSRNQLEDAQQAKERAESESETLSKRNTELAGKLSEARVKLSGFLDMEEKLLRCERRLAEVQRGERFSSGSSLDVWESKCRKLERTVLLREDEIRGLKSKIQDSAELYEQIEGLGSKLERQEQYIQELEKKYSEAGRVLETQQLWEQTLVLLFEDNCSTPKELQSCVQKLFDEIKVCKEAENAAKLRVAELELSHDELRKSQLDCESELKHAKGELEHVKSSLELVQHKYEVTLRQSVSLDRIVKSYEEERSVSEGTGNSELQSHCESLQQSLSDKNSVIKELEEKLEGLQELESMNLSLSKKLEKCLNEVEVLKSRLGRGEYNTQMTRILHFGKSPKELGAGGSPDQKKELEGLLKEKNKQLGENNRKIESLEKEIASIKVAKERLVEVYRKVTQEFKDVYYELTGMSIDMIGKAKYRIRIKFGQDDNDDSLVFHVPKHSRTPFIVPKECSISSQPMQKHYHQIVDENNKEPIAINLARLTVDLFETFSL